LEVGILKISANNGFQHAVAQSVIACLVLTSLTVVCYRLHLNLATACLLYVIVVVFLARAGNLASSIVASIIAALCLAHQQLEQRRTQVHRRLDLALPGQARRKDRRVILGTQVDGMARRGATNRNFNSISGRHKFTSDARRRGDLGTRE
jgi:hypothetical protein